MDFKEDDKKVEGRLLLDKGKEMGAVRAGNKGKYEQNIHMGHCLHLVKLGKQGLARRVKMIKVCYMYVWTCQDEKYSILFVQLT